MKDACDFFGYWANADQRASKMAHNLMKENWTFWLYESILNKAFEGIYRWYMYDTQLYARQDTIMDQRHIFDYNI